MLPPSMEWPRLSTGEHCTFVGQIALGTLQASALPSPLPSQGSLLFFADTHPGRGGPRQEGAVLFVPEATAGLTEAVPPATLMPLYGNEGYPGSWSEDLSGKSGLAGVFPRWPVEGILAKTFSPLHPDSAMEFADPTEDDDHLDEIDRYEDLVKSVQNEAWKTALGQTSNRVIADTLVSGYSRRGADWPFNSCERGRPWMPDNEWPYVWINVRMAVAGVLEQCKWKKDSTAALAATASQWLRKAPLSRAFEEIGSQEKQNFRSWFATLQIGSPPPIETYKVHRIIAESVVLGADFLYGYAPELSSRLPLALRVIVENRAAPCSLVGGRTTVVRHQLLGYPTSVQNAPARMEPSYMLLMQFDSDQSIFWMWGDMGMLQFWIRPEDLKNRRFDRVVLTEEGY